MPAALRAELLALNLPGDDELRRSCLSGNALAALYAQAVRHLLEHANVDAKDVCAIGAHGQTIRHQPLDGYTIQVNSPALLAELTGIDVIADFRTRDVAAGGQGAPLVPAFHEAVFADDKPRVVLNLGGIANITVLDPRSDVRGFDTGPANVLLDLWMEAHHGLSYDEDGRWAAGGHVNTVLLDDMLASEPWFALAPPKSTGRDLFNWAWLSRRLESRAAKRVSAQDIQATLQALTARAVASAIAQAAPAVEEVLVCGGGALNASLMERLQATLPCPVRATSECGMPVQLVEALAFAWLAQSYVHERTAGLPSVTGARQATILGCRYQA
jgi:anhydro-N-acetylmuramic acid kinase